MMTLHRCVLQGATLNHSTIKAASTALLEASARVLGTQASAGARFHWITQVLDGAGKGSVPVASLRVECFSQLFGAAGAKNDG